MRCSITRTGDTPEGMRNTDVLMGLDENLHWSEQKVDVAAAFLEMCGWLLTHIDHKEATGFFYATDKDIVGFIYFSDILKMKWVNTFSSDVSVSFEGQGGGMVCTMECGENKASFSSGKITDLDSVKLITTLKCAIYLLRKGVKLFK